MGTRISLSNGGGSAFPHPHPTISILTSDADVGFPALGGAGRAPGDALAPVVFWPEELLHLLAGNLNAYFSDNQTCRGTRTASQCHVQRKEGAEVCLLTKLWDLVMLYQSLSNIVVRI